MAKAPEAALRDAAAEYAERRRLPALARLAGPVVDGD
jgi:hypothetical protein